MGLLGDILNARSSFGTPTGTGAGGSGYAGQAPTRIPLMKGDISTQVPGVVWRPGKGYVNAKTGMHYAMPGVLPINDPKVADRTFGGSQKAADAYTTHTDQKRVILPSTTAAANAMGPFKDPQGGINVALQAIQGAHFPTPVVQPPTGAGGGGGNGGAGTGGSGGGGGNGAGNTGTVTPSGAGSLSDDQLAQLINSASQGLNPSDIALLSKQSNKDALASIMPQVNALKIQQQGLEDAARSRAQLILQAGNSSANLLSKQLPSYTYAGAGKDLAAIGNLYGNSLNNNQQGAVDDVAKTVGDAGGSFNPYTTSGFNTATAPALGTSATSFGSAALPAELFAKNAAAQAQINHTMPLSLIGGAKQGALMSIGAGQQAAEKISPEIQNVLASLPKYAQADLKSLMANANLTVGQRLSGLKLYLAEHDKTAALGLDSRKLDQGDRKLSIDQQTSTSLANRRAAQTWEGQYRLEHPASQQVNPQTLANQLAFGSGAHTVSKKNADGSSASSLVKAIPAANNLTQAALIYAQNTGTSLTQAMQILAPYHPKTWGEQYSAMIQSQTKQGKLSSLFSS